MAFNFFHTLHSRPGHRAGTATYLSRFGKHCWWQLVKRFHSYPLRLPLGQSLIELNSREAADACGSLINLFGLYDANLQLLNAICKNLPEKWVFLDVGANTGVYSIVASESNVAQVHAFEPHPVTMDSLRNNVALNNRSNVTCVQAAVADVAGSVDFTDIPGSPVNHIASGTEGCITVPAITLDQYCSEGNLRPLGIKIDVEGLEAPVLRGSREILTECVQFLFLEENNPHEILPILHQAGFEGPFYFNVSDKTLTTVSTGEDAIFFRPQFKEFLLRLIRSI